MTEYSKPTKKYVTYFWLATVAAATLFAVVQVVKDRARTEELLAGAGGNSESILPDYGKIGEFAFADQEKRLVTDKSLAGRVWSFNLMFTTCQGPCPLMTHNMSGLQRVFANSEAFRLVSLTVDPQRDTSEVLKAYGDSYKANHETWHFLTGDMDKILDFAAKTMKLPAGKQADLHSTKVVLIDQSGVIRGYYDSTNSGQMELLRAHAKLLLSKGST